MNSDIEFIKSVAGCTARKYCLKYNVDYSNLVKGHVKDLGLVKRIREELEKELRGILNEIEEESTN